MLKRILDSRATSMPWPVDPEHDYELWLEKTATNGLHCAYVTAMSRALTALRRVLGK
jgi:hypothetical protein